MFCLVLIFWIFWGPVGALLGSYRGPLGWMRKHYREIPSDLYIYLKPIFYYYYYYYHDEIESLIRWNH